jgi:hypothetical protein
VKKAPVIPFRRDREKPPEQPDRDVVLGIDVDLRLFRQGHFDARVHKKGAEQVEHPMEARQHAHADQNEYPAHHDRAEDAPEKHAMLPLRGDLEKGENDDEDENVVDAQAEFHEVGREELLAEFGAAPAIDQGVEGERQATPHAAPHERLLRLHLVRAAVEHPEVDGQQCRNKTKKPTQAHHGRGGRAAAVAIRFGIAREAMAQPAGGCKRNPSRAGRLVG